MKVNISKTKIVVFSKRKSNVECDFKFKHNKIEICDGFTYLGLKFNYNGSFMLAKKTLIEQAQKAMYSVFRKIQNLPLAIDLQLKLFDTLILPILTYCCEVWGFENITEIERVHLNFCKRILRIRQTTPNFMVYGELGRFPLSVHIRCRMISFWCKLQSENKLASKLYHLLIYLKNFKGCKFRWLDCIENICNSTGNNFLLIPSQQDINSSFIKLSIKKTLQDQFIQSWSADILNSSRGKFYGIFKSEFQLEPYLLRLNNIQSKWLCKFRTNNIKLPIETGRWENIHRDNRVCKLCFQGIGDEFHYLFLCKHEKIDLLRSKYVPLYFSKFPSISKMKGLLSLCHVELLINISKFIKELSVLL